jgi:hypothetical protein
VRNEGLFALSLAGENARKMSIWTKFSQLNGLDALLSNMHKHLLEASCCLHESKSPASFVTFNVMHTDQSFVVVVALVNGSIKSKAR